MSYFYLLFPSFCYNKKEKIATPIQFTPSFFINFIQTNPISKLLYLPNQVNILIKMWTADPYNYTRRPTKAISIGKLMLGGEYPIRIQSMANTDTNDIEKSTRQCLRIIEAGGEMVRFTTQGKKEVENLQKIHTRIQNNGTDTPLVADIHFNANLAKQAAHFLEKVRINPGNYVGSIKKDKQADYSEELYREEFELIKVQFTQLITICKENNTAIRIGVNHGSLSERMLNRWGNSPEGMVASCMEFLAICQTENFHNIAISMKASNTVLMIQAVRLLVKEMSKKNYAYPIHLGVTEAGDGEDGRIKSAVGIGGLLAEGIGDTIRVSLSEEPEAEIPVAKKIVAHIANRSQHPFIRIKSDKPIQIIPFQRRITQSIGNIGGENAPVVIATKTIHKTLQSDYTLTDINTIETPNGDTFSIHTTITIDNVGTCEKPIFLQTDYTQLNAQLISTLKKQPNIIILLQSHHINPTAEMRAFAHTLIAENCQNPIILTHKYAEKELETLQIKSAIDFGILFVERLADGILLTNENSSIDSKDILSTAFGILQAARVRTSKTEFISCPGCGRTLFQLQDVIAKIKQETSHLKGLKIGIMGCIVNGPGEMADADYGYVGAGRGKISLYKKQMCMRKNVPENDAVKALIDLIKEHNDWVEPTQIQ